MTEPTSYDIVILGAGPAGCTAAVYSARNGLKTLILGGSAPGGQLLLTSDIENFPGLPEPVAGAELMERMHRQCRRLGVEIVTDEASDLNLGKRPFAIAASSGKIYSAKAIIIATGARARWLGIESEKRLAGKGVSACATCDGFFFKGEKVCVVGGGNAAIEDALFLTKFAASVTVIHRRKALRASPAMQERALKNPKIAFAWDSIVEEILGGKSVTGVRIKNTKTSGISEIPCRAVFIAIGHVPDTRILRGQVKLDDNDYIITDGKTRTSAQGVFAAGDVMDPDYRQAVTAAGTGCMAAIEAARYLEATSL